MEEESLLKKVVVWDTANQREIYVEADGESTVYDIKMKLMNVSGTPIEYLGLSVANKELEDETLLDNVSTEGKGAPPSWSSYMMGAPPVVKADNDVLRLDLTYVDVQGGCPDAGWVCCDCCGMAAVCRPFECISRCMCFFAGCDLGEWNSVQCFCWRCYCCMTTEQEEKATG